MSDLREAAEEISNQLTLANDLAFSISGYAHNGTQVESGTSNVALIETSLVDRYNAALDNVANQSYINAQELLLQDAEIAFANMDAAIDDLVVATSVLQEVTVVADMAANAVTEQQQQEVTAAVNMTDMSISQQDVDNFNNAVVQVETYANEAAAFVSAANNVMITTSIEDFATQANVGAAQYTGSTYQAEVDMMIVTFADEYGTMEISGPVGAYTKSATEIYFEVNYGG